MPESPALSPARRGQVRAAWIADQRTDLTWYIGSALVGWFYSGLVWLFGRSLEHPQTDAAFSIPFAGREFQVTLTLLVFWSWAFVFDGPHLWGTLGRTFLDPDEREGRAKVLAKSWILFLVGPVLIFLPWLALPLLGRERAAHAAAYAGLGTGIFYFWFRLWAYYHVVRQHWGFFRLYKVKAGDFDPTGDRFDTWFFNAALYLPLALFLTAPWYPLPTGGYPDLGLSRVMVTGNLSLGAFLHGTAWGLLATALLIYAAFQIRLYLRGGTLNGPKLLLLASIVPLHLAAFSSPLLALFIIPIVTVGHNLQYHRIVWSYARSKYFEGRGEAVKKKKYSSARRVFGSPAAYMAYGLIFTFFFFRGPWIEFLQDHLGRALDGALLAPTLSAAGLSPLNFQGVGEQLFASFLIGWSLQHYYLDGRIWRVNKDEEVRKNLGLT